MSSMRMSANLNDMDVKCPKCKSGMVLRNGKHGKFYGCTRFPKCKGTRGEFKLHNKRNFARAIFKTYLHLTGKWVKCRMTPNEQDKREAEKAMKKAGLITILMVMFLTLPLITSAELATGLTTGQPAPFTGILVPEDMMKTYLEQDMVIAKVNYELKVARELLSIQEQVYAVPWLRSPEVNRWIGFVGGLVLGVYLVRNI